VPDNASAEETNSRLLRRRSLLFSGTANSFLLVLAGLNRLRKNSVLYQGTTSRAAND
jgi:hypothetical protein